MKSYCIYEALFATWLEIIFVFKKSYIYFYFLFRILGKIKIKEDSCLQTIQEKEKEGKGRNRNGNSGIKQLHVLVLHYKKKCRCTHLNKSSSHTYRSINLCFSCLLLDWLYKFFCSSTNESKNRIANFMKAEGFHKKVCGAVFRFICRWSKNLYCQCL